MKKYILFSLIFFILGIGCKNYYSHRNSPENIIPERIDGSVNYQQINDVLSKDAIVEIKDVPPFELPDDIYQKQLRYYFKAGTLYFALAQQGNMNVVFDSPKLDSDAPKASGLLYAEQNDKRWKYLLNIKDKIKEHRNNPFYVWNIKNKIYLLVIDDSGAGSGEGHAKLITSSDGGKNWSIEKCFYSQINNFGVARGQKQDFLQWLKRNIDTPYDKGGMVLGYKYVFNSSKAVFETTQFNKDGVKELITDEDCTNLFFAK